MAPESGNTMLNGPQLEGKAARAAKGDPPSRNPEAHKRRRLEHTRYSVH
jgi:hypothetical protein